MCSHQSFLLSGLTQQTRPVTLPHRHQRPALKRLSETLAEIYGSLVSSARQRHAATPPPPPPHPLPLRCPFFSCASCVKLANALMTHLLNFYTCTDKLQRPWPLASGALRLSRLPPFISFEKYVTRAISIYQRVYQSFPPARRAEEGRTSRPDILRTGPALPSLFSLTREAFCSCQSPFSSKPARREMEEPLSDWFLV